MTDGGTSSAVAVLAGQLRSVVRATTGMRAVVLIDGLSGAGKSTLAAALAEAMGAQLVGLDAVYPGWGGLELGSVAVPGMLDRDNPGYRRWDWGRNEPAEWHRVSARQHLVIEGCGALSAENRRLATYGIWVRLDAVERRRRVAARDGERQMGHWDYWAAQEQAFLARERPDLLADAIVDGRTGSVELRRAAS